MSYVVEGDLRGVVPASLRRRCYTVRRHVRVDRLKNKFEDIGESQNELKLKLKLGILCEMPVDGECPRIQTIA